MIMYFSAHTKGFYHSSIHGQKMPEDAVPISGEQHLALLKGQAAGKVISADASGNPILVDSAPASAEEPKS